MKAIGIVGFKKSGKTTLIISIARLLIGKGYRVAVIKHSGDPINHGNTDTGRFMQEIPQVAIISPENSEIIFKDSQNLKEIIPYFSADFLLVEGFKQAKFFPKIVCVRKEEEEKELNDNLVLFTAGIDVPLKEKKVIDYLISEEKDLENMAKRIEKRAFLLPDINCGQCGYQNCYELGKEIVKGTESEEKCVYLQNILSIHLNKKRVYLNPFMSKLYQNMIYGMFSPLKDIDSLENAQIEIKLGSTNEFRQNSSS